MKAAAGALLLVLTGCAASRAVPVAPTPSDTFSLLPSLAAPSPSPVPCGLPATQVAGALTAAAGRPVVVSLPAGYLAGRTPVVIALHGYDQQASAFDTATGIGTAGAALGVLVLAPQGLGSPSGWDVPGSGSPDDIGMIHALADAAGQDACGGDVSLAGLSDGADMAVTAACRLPGVVRSVLLVAASTGPSPSCSPLGVVQVHGTADPVDAYTGRAADTRRGFGSVKAAGAEQAFAQWSALDGCSGRTDTTTGDLRRLVGVGCDRPVELVAVQGGGHTWPSGTNAASLGRTTTSTDSTKLLQELLAAG